MHGTLSEVTNGIEVTYTPDDQFSGFDIFTYRAIEGGFATQFAQVRSKGFES